MLNDRCYFFFFQAEDGIRAAQGSRGLGDVFKGKAIYSGYSVIDTSGKVLILQSEDLPYSYYLELKAFPLTHLTLPPIYPV